MKTSITFFCALLLLACFTSSFAQGITLELFKGSGNATAYAPPIPITSAQYSFTNGTSTSSGGVQTGRVVFTPLVITKQVDASTASLQRSSFTATNYQYARLNFYRADGSLGYRVVVGTVFVSNYSASGAEGCTSGCPAVSESITLVYGQVATYNPADGGQITTWDAIRNVENVNQTIPQSAIAQ